MQNLLSEKDAKERKEILKGFPSRHFASFMPFRVFADKWGFE